MSGSRRKPRSHASSRTRSGRPPFANATEPRHEQRQAPLRRRPAVPRPPSPSSLRQQLQFVRLLRARPLSVGTGLLALELRPASLDLDLRPVLPNVLTGSSGSAASATVREESAKNWQARLDPSGPG